MQYFNIKVLIELPTSLICKLQQMNPALMLHATITQRQQFYSLFKISAQKITFLELHFSPNNQSVSEHQVI